MNKIENLKELLNQTKADLEEKGFYLDGNAGLERIADMKQYEIAFQACIEKVWPDEAWWKVTKYWDIFQCILAGNTADEVIEEIIAHIDPSMSESTVEDDDFNDELEYNEEYISEEDEDLDESLNEGLNNGQKSFLSMIKKYINENDAEDIKEADDIDEFLYQMYFNILDANEIDIPSSVLKKFCKDPDNINPEEDKKIFNDYIKNDKLKEEVKKLLDQKFDNFSESLKFKNELKDEAKNTSKKELYKGEVYWSFSDIKDARNYAKDLGLKLVHYDEDTGEAEIQGDYITVAQEVVASVEGSDQYFSSEEEASEALEDCGEKIYKITLDEAKKSEKPSKSETGIMKKLRSIKVESVDDDEWEEYDDDFDGYNTEDNFDFDDIETDVADVDSESEEFVYMTVETNKGNADIQDIDYSDIYDGEICVTFKDYDMANYSLGIFEDPEMDVESEEKVEAELSKLEAPLKIKSLDENDDIKYINFNEEQVEQIKQDIRENLGFGYDDEEFDNSLEEGIFDKFKKNKSKITTKAFGYDKNLKFPGPGASKEQDLKTNLNYWEACREAAAYPKSGKVKWTGMNNQGWVVEYDENESMDLIAWEDFADEHPMPKPSSTQPGPQQNQAQRVDNKTDIRLKY